MIQLELIARLMEWAPPVYLFGGFAEDSVLYGRAARPHGDIDVLVFFDELPIRVSQAGGLGFEGFEVRWSSKPNVPLAVGSIVGAVNLEFCVAERSTENPAFFDLPSPEGRLRRIRLPDDAFTYPPQMLDSVEVRTVSPLTLYQVRTALGEIFGLRPKDKPIQAELRKRFFPNEPEASLAFRAVLL